MVLHFLVRLLASALEERTGERKTQRFDPASSEAIDAATKTNTAEGRITQELKQRASPSRRARGPLIRRSQPTLVKHEQMILTNDFTL